MIAITNTATGSQANSAFAPSRQTRPIRVWLTDDNAGFRELLEQLLARFEGFRCEQQFHSAEALLEGLASEPAPDVILLDVEMGGMTGVDALRPIRALAPNVRVLIVTSFWDPMYEAQAVRDGASAYLIKAHAPMNLVAEIQRAIASPVNLAPPAAAGNPSIGQPPRHRPNKRLAARLSSWASHFSTNLIRTTPVSTAEGHT